jgi:hypothetical protein
MHLREVFITRDERRERWRLQPMGWIAGAMLTMLVASLTSGAWQVLSSPRLQVTPTAPMSEAPSASGPRLDPEATSIVRGCPEDPALWSLVPYALHGLEGERGKLYVVDPPCVMEKVERAFAACMDLKAERGRHWSQVDERRCYSTSGFSTILSGEDVAELAPGWAAYGRCQEALKADGSPVTADDLHVAFYTIAEDKQVADVLVVNQVHPTVRTYDCETGELAEESSGDPGRTAVIYYPLLYEDGLWRLAHRHDVANLVSSDEIEAVGMVRLVKDAQGRGW